MNLFSIFARNQHLFLADPCIQCLCLDPNPPTTTTTTKADCGDEQYKGDGNCDDDNNLKSCDWDGGDCCGSGIGNLYCTVVRQVCPP